MIDWIVKTFISIVDFFIQFVIWIGTAMIAYVVVRFLFSLILGV